MSVFSKSRQSPNETSVNQPGIWDVTRVSLKVGLLSFGGPAAQISVMHQEFVETRKWMSEERFLHALNYCMLLPGPEAQQLATYCGWLNGRTLGGLIAGLLFILPGAVAMGGVSYLYAAFGDTSFLSSVFYGIKAGVLAIVLQALLRIGEKALKTRLSWSICIASFCALFLFSVPFPIVIVGAGLTGLVFSKSSPDWSGEDPETAAPRYSRTLTSLVAGLGLWIAPPLAVALSISPDHILVEIAEFFSTLSVVSFGGAYALLSYMAQVAVESKEWLAPGQMLDGLGLAETTPGPLILVTQFVGFLAGWQNPGSLSPASMAFLAAAMTIWVTFVPSFTLVLIGAPWMERLRGNRNLNRALSAITAAVAGTILNLAVWFALNVLFRQTGVVHLGPIELIHPKLISLDWALLAIAAIAVLLTFVAKRGLFTVLSATASLGLLANSIS